MKLLKRLWKTPVFLRLIAFFCFLGALADFGLLCRDFLTDASLWRLHAAFLILYIGQLFFILLQERYVSILTVLQGFFALRTAADFIFTPLLQVFALLYWMTGPTLESQEAYEYIFVSAAFTLQMASAAYIWFYFKKSK